MARHPARQQTLDVQRIARKRFGNDAPWYVARIAFFESADPTSIRSIIIAGRCSVLVSAIWWRIWFSPKLHNGWASAVSPRQQWFAIDSGKQTHLSRAELAFFADGKQFAAPSAYRLQMRTASGWRNLYASSGVAVANGLTQVS